MPLKVLAVGVIFLLLLPHSLGFAAENLMNELVHQSVNPRATVAYRMLELTLEASGRNVEAYGARPTILARSMAIVMTAMYDAWAAYDGKAVATRPGARLRQPEAERTDPNREAAIFFATFRALLDVYPEDGEWLRQQRELQRSSFKSSPGEVSSPEAIGNAAADAVLEYRRHDGANQLGDEPGGNGKPYADYTYYTPKNAPVRVLDPTHWMAIPFVDAQGKTFFPGFLTAHWYRVKPFALERADQFRPGPPPQWGSAQLKKEVQECIEVNAKLTPRQKAIVEFMRDGPRSTGQSGHWLRFAQDVSRRDHFSLDQDVKLFFTVANVVHDTFVASWDAKRFYDTSRPYWWVRQYFPGQRLLAWAGPGKGVAKIPAEQWHPYSPKSFVTPPFPGYTSGHATASGGAARILEHFTDSDRFGAVAVREVGALTEAAFSLAQMQAVGGKLAIGESTNKTIRLELPSFSAAAEMAAMSRLWGGYHIRTDNDAGLKLGRAIADYSWPKYEAYFNGTAGTRH